jgi:hypothetical protein
MNSMTSSTGRPRAMVTGGVVFAAVLLIFGGAMAIIEGIAGIAKDNLYVQTANYTLRFSTTAWGWIHLIIGIVVVLAGFYLFTGATWARWIGILVAAVSLFFQFFFIPYYPFWALTLIAIDIVVIWALATARRTDEVV